MMNSRPSKKKGNEKGPLAGFSRMMSKLTGSKPFLMIASVVIAFIIWAIMVASDGTLTRRKTFTGATVSVTGESTLTSRGYIVTDNILELVPTVDMTVEVSQLNYDRATAASYNPHFELSQVTGEGENTLSIVYSSQIFGQVISCEPNTVTVNVERYITRRVPVVLEISGDLPDNLYLKSTKVDPTSLSVSGPQSLVTSISRIVAKLDRSVLSEERMSDRLALDIELQMADGTVVESDKLSVTNQTVITNAITVETEMVPQKLVALDTDAFVSGTPAEGFELDNVQLAETSLYVAGTQEILDAITVITTDDPLDISGATEDVSGYVRLRRLSGIDSTLPTEIGVNATISETMLTRTWRGLRIGTRGLGSRDISLGTSRANVTLTGPYTQINKLTADDISVFVDVTDLEAGSYALSVLVEADGAVDYAYETDVEEVLVTLRN